MHQILFEIIMLYNLNVLVFLNKGGKSNIFSGPKLLVFFMVIKGKDNEGINLVKVIDTNFIGTILLNI